MAPWGPLLLVAATVVAVCAGLLSAHAAMRWRAFEALPPDALALGAASTALSDLAPTLVRWSTIASWAGFLIAFLWAGARRRAETEPPRRPLPPRMVWIPIGFWAVYFVTRQIAISTADPVGLTNATNADGWAWSTVSWAALCVSWAMWVVGVLRYDRVADPAD